MVSKGGGKWSMPAIKGPAPTSAAKPGGSASTGGANSKHSVSPGPGKEIASALNARNK